MRYSTKDAFYKFAERSKANRKEAFAYLPNHRAEPESKSVLDRPKGRMECLIQMYQQRSKWEYKPEAGDFIHIKIPNASKYRKDSHSNTSSALIEMRKAFKENIGLRKEI